jgi:ribosomal protein L11 methyltransferase
VIVIQLEIEINNELAAELEDGIAAIEDCNWVMIQSMVAMDENQLSTPLLTGYFATQDEAREEWRRLRDRMPHLPSSPVFKLLRDEDWQTAYQRYYRAWQIGKLHLIPEWERDHRHIVTDDVAIYLDPGMAFGMCDHPTTRMCLMALNDYCEQCHDHVGEKSVIDVGCGSGILTLAAAKLGFNNPYGFDNDPIAVRVSRENAAKNNMVDRVRFELQDIAGVLPMRTADVILANQLSTVLMEGAELFLRAIRPGGMLTISGILPEELEMVKNHYQTIGKKEDLLFSCTILSQDNWRGIHYLFKSTSD